MTSELEKCRQREKSPKEEATEEFRYYSSRYYSDTALEECLRQFEELIFIDYFQSPNNKTEPLEYEPYYALPETKGRWR